MISVDGGINAGDIATVTIGANTYTYTVLATDTLTTIQNTIINLINSKPDPYVYATASNEYNRIILTALTPGPAGEGTAVAATVTGTNAALSLTVFNATLCCDNQQGALVTTDNPAVPGEFLYVFATGLGPTSPSDVQTGQVYQGGELNPAPYIRGFDSHRRANRLPGQRSPGAGHRRRLLRGVSAEYRHHSYRQPDAIDDCAAVVREQRSHVPHQCAGGGSEFGPGHSREPRLPRFRSTSAAAASQPVELVPR